MYRLYVDEVGTDDLVHLDKDKHRYLSLTGLAMKVTDARDVLGPALASIKARVFNQDPDSPITFHRKEILGRKGPYGCLADPDRHKLFNDMLLDVVWETPYTLFTALIDKQWMLKQKHWQKSHPYHYLMEMLVERYVFFLERNDTTGDIMPEARMGKKDELLQKAFDFVRENGTGFIRKERISWTIRASTLKFKTKKDNIAGLQLCDLLAHPSHIYTRVDMAHAVQLGPFADKIVDALIERKYDRVPPNRIIGIGIKYLPQ